jgi:hypothetical protein
VQNGDRKVSSSCCFNCGWKFPEMRCSTIRNLLAPPSMKSKLYKFCFVVQTSSQSIVVPYVKIMSTSRNRYTHFLGVFICLAFCGSRISSVLHGEEPFKLWQRWRLLSMGIVIKDMLHFQSMYIYELWVMENSDC